MFSAGNNINNDIDVNQLVTRHNKRKDTRLKIYSDIYAKCCAKIKYINDVLFERECYFNIPNVRWGLPLYQHKAALGFVMIRLRGKGMDVHYVNEDTLYINWNKLIEGAMNDAYPAYRIGEFDTVDGIINNGLEGIADTTVPKPSNISGGLPSLTTMNMYKDDRFDKIETMGCTGDCCKEKQTEEAKQPNKKQKLEIARQQQQHKIENLLIRNKY